jgi:glucose/arabinose dehydrogenase
MRQGWARLAGTLAPFVLGACSTSNNDHPPPPPPPDGNCAPVDAAAGAPHFCDLPGSVLSGGTCPAIVPGGPSSAPDLSWLTVPQGFCVHYFATVPYARKIRFAPGGELFVSSPSTPTTGGGGNGKAGIIVVPDDDKDGFGDSTNGFMGGLASTQGILFANGSLYYQDATKVMKVAYKSGDRTPSGTPAQVTQITTPQSNIHWPKNIEQQDDGTILVTNGGDQGDQCLSTHPLLGSIFSIDATGTPQLVSRGYRNPIGLRCHKGFGVCIASELVKDYSANDEGREKLVNVVPGSDFGYPCCAAQNTAYSGVTYQDTMAAPDCSHVAPESDAFYVGHTPFGFDFEPAAGAWPSPWGGRIYLAMHGEFASWVGARVVAIATDPHTGLPVPTTEPTDGTSTADGVMQNFAAGWDDGTHAHGRPADVTFAADGRMFLADDVLGVIVWIAPVTLTR